MENLLIRISLLGALVGLMAGWLVVAFRFCIEWAQVWLLPGGIVGNFEAFPGWIRLLFPLCGALVLGVIFERLPPVRRKVGITHLLDYLRFRKQRLPFRNALVQFIGGVITLASGQSMDREGPAVHIGAATVSLFGPRFNLSDEDTYLLAAAGGAAAIAATFNTPLAGVIFVIEVLRVRYELNNIVPIAVAAVIGAIVGRSVYGAGHIFAVSPVDIGSSAELPVMLLMGLIIGVLAAGFMWLIQTAARKTIDWRPLGAFLLAGLVTGVLAQWAPQIMGLSYDSLLRIFRSELGLETLLLVLGTKLVATALSVGMRLPGGVIGPTLVIGGAVGGATELLIGRWDALFVGNPGFYTMIGMVAMMGAVLRAPLAALVALIELTGNLNIVLPGMIAMVSAEITTRALMGDASAFTVMLKVQHEREILQADQDAASQRS